MKMYKPNLDYKIFSEKKFSRDHFIWLSRKTVLPTITDMCFRCIFVIVYIHCSEETGYKITP
jgi:hypothetical protein